MKNTINPSTNQSYTIDFRPDLTVGEMRGKILISQLFIVRFPKCVSKVDSNSIEADF